jgi:ubiquinone/menaquinone biosynthesis C-methylase UbiE
MNAIAAATIALPPARLMTPPKVESASTSLRGGHDGGVERDLVSVLLELAPPAGRLVVDVGCGEGAVVRRFAAEGATAIGIETGAEPLARARAHAPVGGERYLEGAGEALPLDDASADAVLFVQSLHHVPEPAAALAEAARVVRPGGAIVVVEPLAEGPFFGLVAHVDDETRVRALAQAAIARAPLPAERELRFDVLVRLASFAAFRDRITLADATRTAIFAAREDELRAAYDALAGPGGELALPSPYVAHLLRRP